MYRFLPAILRHPIATLFGENMQSATWYLVKSNTRPWESSYGGFLQGEYLGLGGNMWPIDELHEELLRKREYVRLHDGQEIFVITNIDHARQYFNQANRLGFAAVLLEVSDPSGTRNQDGYDFGDPEGGYSLVESELLVADRKELLTKYIDRRTGLFRNLVEMQSCLDEMPDGEDLNSYYPVAIRRVE